VEIAAQNISFGYKEADFPLFETLSFKITSPGFYSLFGFSGCGKSTLARILAGMLKPEKGTVETRGLNRILLAYNTERFPGWLTVGEHVTAVASEEAHPRGLDFFIHELGLQEVVDKRYFRLSMGQKNRANLLRYLVQDFDMLICDEVLANVDEPSRNHILALVKELFSREKLILYISHNVEEVCFFSKKVFVVPAGEGRIKRLVEVSGIDGAQRAGASRKQEENLQATMLEVLRAASTTSGAGGGS